VQAILPTAKHVAYVVEATLDQTASAALWATLRVAAAGVRQEKGKASVLIVYEHIPINM
jgi:hypothetical protein